MRIMRGALAVTFRDGVSSWGLRKRAVATVSVIVLVAVLGASIPGVIHTTGIIKENRVQSLESMAATFATAVGLPLAVGDRDELERLGKTFMGLDDELSVVQINDPQSGVRVSLVRTATGIETRLTVEAINASLMTASAPVEFSTIQSNDDLLFSEAASDSAGNEADVSSQPALITLGARSDSMRSAIAMQWSVLSGTLALILLVALPVIYFAVARMSARIERLSAASKRIAQGDYLARVQDSGNDEISELGRAFDQMRKSIRYRIDQEQKQLVLLEEARNSAERANGAKSQFLAHMSHEIRTPLNGVIGMLELLSRTSLQGDQLRHIQIAKRSADTLLSLINDILDFSKIEAGGMELESTAFNIVDAFDSAVELLAAKASAKQIELLCTIDRAVPRWVNGDPEKLSQVIINLINNAIKFTDHGEIVVRLALDTEQADQSKLNLRASVSDTGIGIPKEKQNRLFKSFSQVDASTTRQYGGTGLGLAISKGIVNLMGGEIGIIPDQSIGSTFWFTFEVERAEQPQEARMVYRDLKGVRTLIVDDNETNREILQEALQGWDIQADQAEDALIALKMVQQAQEQDQYELIILDMQMPNMDGAQFADLINSDPCIETPRMIMLTSMYESASSLDKKNLGLSACIHKPIKLSLLYETIVSVMAGVSSEPKQRDTSKSEPAHLDGAHVLVAEDNAVNQIVVRELLSSLGITMDLAVDGREAVEMLNPDLHACVLMDCEMPEMDGFAATKTIREKEIASESDSYTPIIALTANAVRGDRERCLEAGMDEYLTKPIDPDRMRTVLSQFISSSCVEQDSESDALEGSTSESSLTSSSGSDLMEREVLNAGRSTEIDMETALQRCAGSTEVLVAVLNAFSEMAETYPDELRELVEVQDANGMRTKAHNVKGAAANVGAIDIAEIASRIERGAEQGDIDAVASELRALDETTQEFLAALPSLIQSLENTR